MTLGIEVSVKDLVESRDKLCDGNQLNTTHLIFSKCVEEPAVSAKNTKRLSRASGWFVCLGYYRNMI